MKCHRPYTSKMMNAALLNLRAEIIRDQSDGLVHVEALLRIRGVETGPVPRKIPKHFRRGELRTAILRSLRHGPRTGPEIAREIASATNTLTYTQVYKRVYRALCRMREAGLVERGGGVWRLAP